MVIPIWAMSRLPWIWEDPLTFNPDRFDKTYTPAEYPVFNVPPRSCLGKHVALMEAKVAVAQLFRTYNLKPVKGHKVEFALDVTHPMKNGLLVRLEKRKF